MATPLKPWEIKATDPAHGRDGNSRVSGTARPSMGTSTPPAIPPRSTMTNTPYSTSGYYTPAYQGLGSYGYRPFGMYGSYGGYGGYGGGYGGYGGYGQATGDSEFVRQAEERTRTAFQYVESLVGAFGSVSMMLESTYFAVHSCFRAVLGVAQHFTTLKNHVWGIIAAIAILRRLRWWLKRILSALHLRRSSNTEEAWDDLSVQHQRILVAEMPEANSRMWPVAMFFIIIIGVPWLLWKILSSLLKRQESESEENPWSNGDNQPIVAKALYDFNAERNDEISFSAGDELVLAPSQLQSGWLLAGRNRRSGLVPANYVVIISSVNGSGRRSSGEPQPNQTTPPRHSLPDLLHDEENLLND